MSYILRHSDGHGKFPLQITKFKHKPQMRDISLFFMCRNYYELYGNDQKSGRNWSIKSGNHPTELFGLLATQGSENKSGRTRNNRQNTDNADF